MITADTVFDVLCSDTMCTVNPFVDTQWYSDARLLAWCLHAQTVLRSSSITGNGRLVRDNTAKTLQRERELSRCTSAAAVCVCRVRLCRAGL